MPRQSALFFNLKFLCYLHLKKKILPMKSRSIRAENGENDQELGIMKQDSWWKNEGVTMLRKLAKRDQC